VQNLESLKKLINYKAAFTITAVVFVGLAALNLICTNVLATEGIAVSEAETKTIKLEKENQIISVKIEEASQLKNIEALAENRGFIRSKNIVFVPTPPTFAQR
jgi:Na+-transporting NADH:ubiquinone oxidoreductase subunit NqrC